MLFDTGMHQPDSLAHLERALAMCGLRLEDASLVVCTHAHSDHCGQAAPILERAGCELWMHPSHELHERLNVEDPDAVLARSDLRSPARAACPRSRCAATPPNAADRRAGIAGPFEPTATLLDGVVVATDLGEWIVYETPGHAPSHVCLFQPERRLLISGDHLLGRISLYFDFGYSPDPVGEFLSSLDVVEGLGARLCLAGHGRTFADVQPTSMAIARSSRSTWQASSVRWASSRADARSSWSRTCSARRSHQQNGQWLLSQTLGYLTHLEAIGERRRMPGEPERWTA